MAGYPPGIPPIPPVPPPGFDYRGQRQFFRDQAKAQRAAFRAQRDQIRFQMRGMRRGSVLGPILLIAIGVLFLLIQTGHLDHHIFWSWYGRWWPLLLVAGGVVLLAEWSFDQFWPHDPQQPGYRRAVGGGVVTLVLLIIVAGVAARNIESFPAGHSYLFPGFHFGDDNLDEIFGDKHESDETLDLSFAKGDTLTIANPRGGVTVSGTSDDNSMHLAIHKQIYAHSDADADAKAKQFNPDNKYRNFAWTVSMPSLEGASADLVISVPASTVVSVTADHGDIHIASIKAPVIATANHGDIELSAITGAATAHMNNGGSSISAHSIDGGISIQGHAEDCTLSDITGPVSMSGEFFGTAHFEHINGAIHFHTSRTDLQLARLDGEVEISPHSDLSVDQALGPVVLTTSGRNITLDRMAGDVSVTNHNGSIDLTAAPPLGEVMLEDRNGSVKVILPEHSGFSLQASAGDGEVNSDFQLSSGNSSSGTNVSPASTETHKNLNGTVGGGGPLVHITTTNGDISIHKGDVLALAPAPPVAPKITLVPPKPPTPPQKKKP